MTTRLLQQITPPFSEANKRKMSYWSSTKIIV